MSKLTAAIIEDEVPAARLLSTIIKRLRPEWEVIVLPGSVEEAIAWFSTHSHPDILFLDIQLSDGNSFDFLSAANPSSLIIFTTAYDQYAIRAFTVNSIDYILKPVDETRLLNAIVKYETLKSKDYQQTENYIKDLIQNLQKQEKTYRTRFLIANVDKFWALQVNDIAYFYSENKITFAVTKSGQEHIIDLSLTRLEEQLNPKRFFRANRQVIVCIDAIVHAAPYFNGKIILHVKPIYKDKITVSEEKVSAFKVWLNF
ncbi:LytR/AlgR family response regulator transcription factor [Bacteroides oleiciplenus]|uniref:DNA-binding response regulator n=1 Tax=Bacteroides oleiciplenus TaxID=626931 RepID=A0A3E5B2C3_9BACE|nr:LytTR family DNA-binding domain-containing protein [Bacteroides oleiciplenus]RGN31634.1 DNA-binding response regulator [Bacteroides oleiciplenus]